MEAEAESVRRRIQFEQFFSADLFPALERDPVMLDGREQVVTVLFADIRGFASKFERLGARQTCKLVADVMDRLTVRVHEFGGSVVDYAGDGLLATWNAPIRQTNHATQACTVALALLSELPGLSAEWGEATGGPIELGVGVNTGLAIVGNTGSRHKFNYGQLGHTVKLANRVESATKFFGVPALVIGSTYKLFGGSFETLRICRMRVVGIEAGVDLYELHPGPIHSGYTTRARCRDTYEQAITFLETGQWSATCRVIHTALAGQEGNYDGSSLLLATRALLFLKSPATGAFDPILELGAK